jgi:hypothetical protein
VQGHPDGTWGMWVDVDPLHACPRYFGSGAERVVRGPIHVSWPGAQRMIVQIDGGRQLDWEIVLASTLTTRFLSAVGKATPDALWWRRLALSAMAVVADSMLRAGRLSLLSTIAPNEPWFKANPKQIWTVTGGCVEVTEPAGELERLAGPRLAQPRVRAVIRLEQQDPSAQRIEPELLHQGAALASQPAEAAKLPKFAR